MVSPRSNQYHLSKKHNLFIRDFSNFDRESLDILDTEWNTLIVEWNANLSFNKSLDTLNRIIDKYIPLRKLTNREFKRRYKPWITNGIINYINRKNKLFNMYCKTKDQIAKEQVYNDYKLLCNSI